MGIYVEFFDYVSDKLIRLLSKDSSKNHIRNSSTKQCAMQATSSKIIILDLCPRASAQEVRYLTTIHSIVANLLSEGGEVHSNKRFNPPYCCNKSSCKAELQHNHFFFIQI